MLSRSPILALTMVALAALGGCDVAASHGGEAVQASGGSGEVIPPGTGASLVFGSGGALPDPPLDEGTECAVPTTFQRENYESGMASAGGAGGESSSAGSFDPGTLEVGDGDLSVLVVFDKSGSMGDYWGDRTKFWAAHDALMRGVRHYIQNLTLAAILFPVETSCGVPSLLNNRQITWVQGYDFVDRWYDDLCRNQPNGSTPLYKALEVADATIDQAKTFGLLEDRFRVLVLTDGEETCDATMADPTTFVAAWAKQGIETSVIGLPGSESADAILRKMASIGGGTYTPVPATGDPAVAHEVLTGSLDLVLK